MSEGLSAIYLSFNGKKNQQKTGHHIPVCNLGKLFQVALKIRPDSACAVCEGWENTKSNFGTENPIRAALLSHYWDIPSSGANLSWEDFFPYFSFI